MLCLHTMQEAHCKATVSFAKVTHISRSGKSPQFSVLGHVEATAVPRALGQLQDAGAFCAEPHMGGAYSTIAADVIARFQRLQGRDVRFVTGTDEHGEKIAAAAAAAGATPQEHCDAMVAKYIELWQLVRCWLHAAPKRYMLQAVRACCGCSVEPCLLRSTASLSRPKTV